MSVKLTPQIKARPLRILDYARVFGYNRKAASRLFHCDCKEYRVSIITVSLFAKIYSFEENDIITFFG